MGMKLITAENLTENLDFYSEINPKKETILFSSEDAVNNKKIKEKQNHSLISNPTTTEENNKSTKSNSTMNNSEEKVKFKFQWKDKSNNPNKKLEVLLVGSFLKNWENYEVMEKNNENGLYEYEMYLPRKEHLFKFIINNKWQCCDLYETKPDKDNNINNYIDLTNYQSEQVKEKIYNDESFNLSKELNNINQSGSSINKDKSDIKYPELEQLNKKAPKVTNFYAKEFNIDNLSNQDKYDKNKKFVVNHDNNILYGNVNNSYKKVFTFQHEKLGHLISEISGYYKIKNRILRTSTTERKKHKFLTIIYYKPN
jgi:hypothetical protein